MNTGNEHSLQVEQHLEADSEPRLIAFVWKGTRWEINSVGRTWDADNERHFLVMVQGDRVFELAHSTASGTWRMIRSPEDFVPPRTAT